MSPLFILLFSVGCNHCLLLHDTATKLLYSLPTFLLSLFHLLFSPFLFHHLFICSHFSLFSLLPASPLLPCPLPWPPPSSLRLNCALSFSLLPSSFGSASLLIPHPPSHPPPSCLSLSILLFLCWSQAFAALISPSFLPPPPHPTPCYHDRERQRIVYVVQKR